MPRGQTTRVCVLLACLMMLLAAVSCRNGTEVTRVPAAQESAVPFAGVWSVTLTLERPITFATGGTALPRVITGSVALLAVNHDHRPLDPRTEATHTGVYDLDVRALGLPARGPDVPPLVVARTVGHAGLRAQRDSIYLEFNPGAPRHVLYLSGVLTAAGADGVWRAASFLGGGGTFRLRRDTAP